MTVEQVAREWGTAQRTIIGHSERFEEIRRAFKQTDGSLMSLVKELLGDDHSFDEIRIVWLHLRRQGQLPNSLSARH